MCAIRVKRASPDSQLKHINNNANQIISGMLLIMADAQDNPPGTRHNLYNRVQVEKIIIYLTN